MGRRASVGHATKSVAIKLMAPRVAGDERHRRMFLDEARLSMLMTHSNVVQVFDAGEDEGRLFLVMEWIDGLNLAQLMELQRRSGQPLDPRMTGYIIGEVLRGLAYAHHLIHEGQQLCVVHRDMSPHNVLISTSGEVKIADFGVARLASEETTGMHIKGKLRYMAPEQLAGHSREPTVDLYGAGAVLHELLSGDKFRHGLDEVDLYGHILGGQIPPLEVPGLPPELVSLRLGLLQGETRQRIPSAGRALEYLSAWAGYRNMAVELAQLCRAAMGVQGPRSGIERSGSQPSEAVQVDAMADTASASASSVTPTRTSGAVPSQGRVPVNAETVAGAPPAPDSASRRRFFFLVGGMAGAGVVLGGVGVFALTGDEPAPEPSEPASGEPAAEPPSKAAAAAAPDPVADGVGQGAPATEESGGIDPDAGTTSGERTSDGTGEEPSEASTGAAQAPPPDEARPSSAAKTSSKPRSKKPKGKATVAFGLRSPLRYAEVRVGKNGPVTVAPKAKRTYAAGRHTLVWKAGGGEVWVNGGTFEFEAGKSYEIRLTRTGPVLE